MGNLDLEGVLRGVSWWANVVGSRLETSPVLCDFANQQRSFSVRRGKAFFFWTYYFSNLLFDFSAPMLETCFAVLFAWKLFHAGAST